MTEKTTLKSRFTVDTDGTCRCEECRGHVWICKGCAESAIRDTRRQAFAEAAEMVRSMCYELDMQHANSVLLVAVDRLKTRAK